MIFIIFILSTLGFAFIAIMLQRRKQEVKIRIKRLIPNNTRTVINTVEEEDEIRRMKSPIKQLIETLSRNIRTTERRRSKIELELESGAVPLKVEEFISIRLLILVGFFLVAFLLWGNFLLALLVGLIAWKAPIFYIRKRKESRIANFGLQLPQALEMMASGMKSGFSFIQTMQLVSKEMPDPIGTEFQRTIKEINLGIPLDTSFGNLLQRIPNKDLEIVVSAVLIQRSTGGNLAQILETINETITERVRLKDELKALTSQGRMSALVITLLPVLLGLILNVMNPDYFSPMLSHPLGWILLGGGVLSGIMGWVFIQKVVTIEV